MSRLQVTEINPNSSRVQLSLKAEQHRRKRPQLHPEAHRVHTTLIKAHVIHPHRSPQPINTHITIRRTLRRQMATESNIQLNLLKVMETKGREQVLRPTTAFLSNYHP
jgi:hypothetical protein